MRVFLLTSTALVCFASNSLLTRSAIGADRIDAASFMGVRLASGAATLLLLRVARRRAADDRGSWPMACALAAYAILFTLAYERIGAGAGALLLFGAVQVTMIGAGLASGERVSPAGWLGIALATVGLVVLTRPGLAAPDPIGAALMVGAGASWGAYSLAGRGRRDPLGATTGNFVRATLIGAAFLAAWPHATHLSGRGLWLAVASGSLASGIGYTIWYSVVPALAAYRAAVVQLPVPVLTVLGAALVLNEPLTLRLAAATAFVGAGLWLTIHAGAKGRR